MENNASKPPDPEAGQYVATEGELTAQSSFVSDTDGPDVCTKSNVSVIDKETHDRRPSMVWYSDRSDTIQELEQRYIELLRRKIAMFEVEGLENITPHVTTTNQAITGETNPTCSKSESKGDVAEPAKGSRGNFHDQSQDFASKSPTDATGGSKVEDNQASNISPVTEIKKDAPPPPMADHEVDSCAVASSDSETMDKKSRVRYYEHRKDNFGQMVDHPVPKPDPGSKERAEDDDYAIAWRLPLQDDEKDQDTRDARPTLLIESKVLRRALKQVDKGYTGIPFDTEKVAFSWPYELIYHGKKELEELEKISERGNEVLKRDIDILLEEVSKQQAAERNDAEKLAQEGQIRYDLLWTLFYPGKWVITTDTVREEQVFVIATHGIPSGDTSEGYQLDLWSIDFDGTKFACFESYVTIQPFKGAKAIDRLEAFPLDNWGGTVTESRDAVMKRLIQRGCLFENLCNGPPEGSFRQFDGPFIDHGPLDMLVGEKGGIGNQHKSASLRVDQLNTKSQSNKSGVSRMEHKSLVVIDHYAYFNRANTRWSLWQQGAFEDPEACSCEPCINLRKHVIEDLPKIEEIKGGQKLCELTDSQRLLCPPRVFGYAMRDKLWAEVLVKNITKIDQESRKQAWDQLILDQRSKDILKTSVVEQAKNPNLLEDIIPGKGQGLIVLLHGPPGIGKTLTAEALAGLTGKPLFSVSMMDVGTSPVLVETNLLRIFEIATHWKALLLFDEADIFLEQRSLQDLERNSLVSVLLRILEYFKGILFLTSNRVKTFDEAVSSRINIAIRYRELTETQNKRIWNMWIKKVQPEIEDPDEFEESLEEGGDLVKAGLNGRQIRNIFRSALAMATNRPLGQRKVRYADVEQGVKRMVEFQNYMMQNKDLAEKSGIR